MLVGGFTGWAVWKQAKDTGKVPKSAEKSAQATKQSLEGQGIRASDRVFLEIPIIIAGTNTEGRPFWENTKALVLSRRGASIISKQTLFPQQQLKLRCLKTGMGADVRVVGPIMGEAEGCRYGIALLQPDGNIWGINFPLLEGTENPAGRVFLECASCHMQEVVHLDVFELEAFLANKCLTRPCQQCDRATLWTRSASG